MSSLQAHVCVLVTMSFLLPSATAQGLLPPTPKPIAADPFASTDTWGALVDDWNGDGKSDLFFANQSPGGGNSQLASLLFGNGSWRFELGQQLAPASAAVSGDLDGDGDRDLILISNGAVQVWRNQGGTGSFVDVTPTAFRYVFAGPNCLALGDIDGDGDLDLVVGHVGNRQNRRYLNNGAGVFTDGTQGGLPYFNNVTTALRLVDVDGDGDVDLLTGNDNQPLRLALNQGGTFLDATATHLPNLSPSVNAIDVGDVDGDGDLDLAIGCNYTNAANLLLINDGFGHFTDQTAGRLPSWTGIGIALVDADADHDLDLFVPTYLSQAQLFRNDGTGHFTNATSTMLPSLNRSGRGVAIGDLDGDGRTDLVMACEALGYSYDPFGKEVLLQNTPGGLVERFSSLHEPWGGMLPQAEMQTNAVVLIDHDHDGDLDLFVGNDFGQQDRLYDNSGHGVFTDVTVSRLPVESGNTVEVAAGDVNGDGYDDLVLTCYNGTARLWLGTAGGGFVVAPAANLPSTVMLAIAVTLGDIDGDGDLDIVFGCDGQSRVYKNLGSGQFTDWTQFALPPMSSGAIDAVQLIDLDGDGDRDLLMQGAFAVLRFTNDGTGTFTEVPIPGQSSTRSGRMVAADFDGDGDADIFSTKTNYPSGTAYLLQNNGQGTFSITWSAAATGGESTLTATDIDGDGDLDVVATSLQPYANIPVQSRVFLKGGGGTFTSVVFPGTPEAFRGGAVGDVDGDGDLDVVACNHDFMIGQTRLFANSTRHVAAATFLRVGRVAEITTYAQQANGLPGLLAMTFAAISPLQQPLPLPPFGRLDLDPGATVNLSSGVTSSAGSVTSWLAIPANPVLVGLPLYFQALVEGRTPTNQPELRLTNMLRETIQF